MSKTGKRLIGAAEEAAAISSDLQDGLLTYYLSQARASDGNVEPRLEREPFDYREYLRRTGDAYPGTLVRVIQHKDSK